MEFYKLRQNLSSNPLQDVVGEVRKQLDSLKLNVPGGDIAITAGSRGITNIAEITKAVGDWLKDKGANPFIVPAMGSHNGASAQGQQSMLESFGISEKSMQMEIRSSMEVVKLGQVSSGEVFMDAQSAKAGGVIVLNRIKLHTSFAGPVQSGLCKMMVVGMGNLESAKTFHSTPNKDMSAMLLEMAQLVLDTGKILAGVGIIEDGCEQTAEIHALGADQIPLEEPALLKRACEYFPRLPIEELNVLVVDEIGKLFSGTGMDPNVIGYRGSRGSEDLLKPIIKVIAALGLEDKSQGNATGVGLADLITRRLRDSIDESKTFINVFTAGELIRGKIPVTLENDEVVFQKIAQRFGEKRWIIIPNTLELENFYASQDLRTELLSSANCEIISGPIEASFKEGRLQLDF